MVMSRLGPHDGEPWRLTVQVHHDLEATSGVRYFPLTTRPLFEFRPFPFGINASCWRAILASQLSTGGLASQHHRSLLSG